MRKIQINYLITGFQDFHARKHVFFIPRGFQPHVVPKLTFDGSYSRSAFAEPSGATNKLYLLLPKIGLAKSP